MSDCQAYERSFGELELLDISRQGPHLRIREVTAISRHLALAVRDHDDDLVERAIQRLDVGTHRSLALRAVAAETVLSVAQFGRFRGSGSRRVCRVAVLAATRDHDHEYCERE